MIQVRPPTWQIAIDLARWAATTVVREGVPPEEPELVRFMAGVGWRAHARATPTRWAMMVDELRRTFGLSVRTAESAAREAYDLGLQARIERLLVPRLGPEALADWVRLDGEVRGPALVVYPHAGHVLMLVAALSTRAPGLTVFSARGSPPRQRRSVGMVRDTLVNRHLVRRKDREEERLPVRWVTTVDAAEATLRAGGVVAAAFDDRNWTRWRPVPLCGRTALLSPEPWELARRVGAPVLPATVLREHDKSHLVTVGGPIAPRLEAYLHDHAEPWLRANPGHYGDWLVTCRIRAALDDHPLFVDYAPDARWRRWVDRPIDNAHAAK